MSKFHMESASAVNAEHPGQSALSSEAYNPASWSTFEKLNAKSDGKQDAAFLDMGAEDPYSQAGSLAKAPDIGDPGRLNFRQARQEHAIFDGVKSGEIDFDEYTDLQQEQDLLARAEQYFGADGFSQTELQNLDQLQNQARQHILDAGGADELKYGEAAADEAAPEPPEETSSHDSGSEHSSSQSKADCRTEPASQAPACDSGSEPSPGEEFQQFMNFLDQNGDGQISLEELLQAFQSMDENQDGVISPEELQKFMDKLAKDGGSAPEKPEDKNASPEAGGKSAALESGSDSNDSTKEANPGSNPTPGSIADVLAQNDFARRGLVTADAPFHGKDGWAYGKYGARGPEDITPGQYNVGPWSAVYPEEGKSVDPTANVQVKDAATYYHLKTGGWVQAQGKNDNNWWEGNYPAAFDDVPQKGRGIEHLADGTFQFAAPPEGMNDHFGPGSPDLPFDSNLYDGVFSTMQARSDKENSAMVINIGVDHYTEKIKNGKTYGSPAIGGSNWTRLTTDWQPLYYTSLDARTISDDPPPGF